jgi:hypothetical protein
VDSYPIDRVLFEATEFCTNQCFFCYGDYGPEGAHMSPEQFSLYLGNLLKAGLLAPDSLLILFGGEILNHPRCLEIFTIASELKKPTMRLVIITSGKFQEEFKEQVEALLSQPLLLHHWEVSIKDMKSFEFGMKLAERNHQVLLRYDYLNPAALKKSIDTFFLQIKSYGVWKAFKRNNPTLERDLRYARKSAAAQSDAVIVEEFFYPREGGNLASVGLIFSPLDRTVMRKGTVRAEAKCSLFHSQYGTAIHVTREGTVFPCHLPRFKKRCEPLGNATDLDFLRNYSSRIAEFKRALSGLQQTLYSQSGICIEGCRGKLSFSA